MNSRRFALLCFLALVVTVLALAYCDPVTVQPPTAP